MYNICMQIYCRKVSMGFARSGAHAALSLYGLQLIFLERYIVYIDRGSIQTFRFGLCIWLRYQFQLVVVRADVLTTALGLRFGTDSIVAVVLGVPDKRSCTWQLLSFRQASMVSVITFRVTTCSRADETRIAKQLAQRAHVCKQFAACWSVCSVCVCVHCV